MSTREEIMKSVRVHNKISYRPLLATPGYQLLNIANNDIGAASAYHEYEQADGRALFTWTPNQLRDSFIAKTRDVFERRVDHAYMLQPGEREATKLFRDFCNYATGVDWANLTEFTQLMDAHSRVSREIVAKLGARNKRIGKLQARRIVLMHRHDLPYRDVTL